MKVFIGGSKTIMELPQKAIATVDAYCMTGAEFLVGDCFGADRLFQEYLNERGYSKVTVYVSGEVTRNNAGDFPEKHISADGLTGFEFYRAKDKAMAEDADCALMLWDGRTKGTACNIRDMKSMGKDVTVIMCRRE